MKFEGGINLIIKNEEEANQEMIDLINQVSELLEKIEISIPVEYSEDFKNKVEEILIKLNITQDSAELVAKGVIDKKNN